MTIQGGNSATFAYDAGGTRVRKTNLTTGQVTRYPFGAYEIDANSGVITKYFTIGIGSFGVTYENGCQGAEVSDVTAQLLFESPRIRTQSPIRAQGTL